MWLVCQDIAPRYAVEDRAAGFVRFALAQNGECARCAAGPLERGAAICDELAPHDRGHGRRSCEISRRPDRLRGFLARRESDGFWLPERGARLAGGWGSGQIHAAAEE